MPESHRFVRGMVGWMGLRQEALPYERSARFAGTTKYTLSKMLRFALDAVTGFSIKPLRLASWLGVASGAVGLLLIIYVLSSWVRGHTVEGWTSAMSVILILGSSQLLVLGLIGEYLGRLYLQSKNRPLFIIERTVRGPQHLHQCAPHSFAKSCPPSVASDYRASPCVIPSTVRFALLPLAWPVRWLMWAYSRCSSPIWPSLRSSPVSPDIRLGS